MSTTKQTKTNINLKQAELTDERVQELRRRKATGRRSKPAPTSVNTSSSDRLFIKGPIAWNWWRAAAQFGGSVLALASVLWLHVGFERGARRVRLSATRCRELGVSDRTRRRALATLEGAGLVRVERKPGRLPMVTLLTPPVASAPSSGKIDVESNPNADSRSADYRNRDCKESK